eukprot:TRINITY_DN1241_c3_g1_i2.p1 TRINITY_DN1241_c3_g1~~TRINITY_DN1241_c3_g1_i2.p1  ORF type:complete len:114 (-),score=13.48 TRINITY_DN1241_c3_g1_i2:185-502(-)
MMSPVQLLTTDKQFYSAQLNEKIFLRIHKMKWFLVIVFSLLQICLAQNSAIELFAAGSVGKGASGVAAVKAVGDKVSGVQFNFSQHTSNFILHNQTKRYFQEFTK